MNLENVAKHIQANYKKYNWYKKETEKYDAHVLRYVQHTYYIAQVSKNDKELLEVGCRMSSGNVYICLYENDKAQIQIDSYPQDGGIYHYQVATKDTTLFTKIQECAKEQQEKREAAILKAKEEKKKQKRKRNGRFNSFSKVKSDIKFC